MKITKQRLIEIIKEELVESMTEMKKPKHDELEYELRDEEPWADRKRSKISKPTSSKPAVSKEKPSFFSTWLQTDIPMGYKDSEGRDLKQAKSHHKAQIYKVGPDAAFNEIEALAQAAEKAQDAVARKFVSKVKDAMLDMYG